MAEVANQFKEVGMVVFPEITHGIHLDITPNRCKLPRIKRDIDPEICFPRDVLCCLLELFNKH